MANDINEEEAVLIGTTTAFLRAMSAFLRNHNCEGIDSEVGVLQIPRPRDVDTENYIDSVLYFVGTLTALTKFE